MAWTRPGLRGKTETKAYHLVPQVLPPRNKRPGLEFTQCISDQLLRCLERGRVHAMSLKNRHTECGILLLFPGVDVEGQGDSQDPAHC